MSLPPYEGLSLEIPRGGILIQTDQVLERIQLILRDLGSDYLPYVHLNFPW